MLAEFVGGKLPNGLTEYEMVQALKNPKLLNALKAYAETWEGFSNGGHLHETTSYKRMSALLCEIPECDAIKYFSGHWVIRSLLSEGTCVSLDNLVRYIDYRSAVITGFNISAMYNLINMFAHYEFDPYPLYKLSSLKWHLEYAARTLVYESMMHNEIPLYVVGTDDRNITEELFESVRNVRKRALEKLLPEHSDWKFVTMVLDPPKGCGLGRLWHERADKSYTAEQIEWCKKNAPDSLRNLSDSELWAEMKYTQESVYKEGLSYVNAISQRWGSH